QTAVFCLVPKPGSRPELASRRGFQIATEQDREYGDQNEDGNVSLPRPASVLSLFLCGASSPRRSELIATEQDRGHGDQAGVPHRDLRAGSYAMARVRDLRRFLGFGVGSSSWPVTRSLESATWRSFSCFAPSSSSGPGHSSRSLQLPHSPPVHTCSYSIWI